MKSQLNNKLSQTLTRLTNKRLIYITYPLYKNAQTNWKVTNAKNVSKSQLNQDCTEKGLDKALLSPRVMVKATQQSYATGERSEHVESMVLILQTGRKRYR